MKFLTWTGGIGSAECCRRAGLVTGGARHLRHTVRAQPGPGKRSRLGAHYTSKEDILLIVEPVVIKPLQRRWQAVKAEATAKAEAAEKAKGREYTKLRANLEEIVLDWVAELAAVRVLDPACGSGNFLYIALRRMLDLSARNPASLPHRMAFPPSLNRVRRSVPRARRRHQISSANRWRISLGVSWIVFPPASYRPRVCWITASVYCASVCAPGLYWRVRLPFRRAPWPSPAWYCTIYRASGDCPARRWIRRRRCDRPRQTGWNCREHTSRAKADSNQER